MHVYYVNPLQHAEGMLYRVSAEGEDPHRERHRQHEQPDAGDADARHDDAAATTCRTLKLDVAADRADPRQADPVERLREAVPGAAAPDRERRLDHEPRRHEEPRTTPCLRARAQEIAMIRITLRMTALGAGTLLALATLASPPSQAQTPRGGGSRRVHQRAHHRRHRPSRRLSGARSSSAAAA